MFPTRVYLTHFCDIWQFPTFHFGLAHSALHIYLSPLVYLFHKDSHHCLYTLVYESLYVLYCLLLVQIQTKLVLDLRGREGGREGGRGEKGGREGGGEREGEGREG